MPFNSAVQPPGVAVTLVTDDFPREAPMRRPDTSAPWYAPWRAAAPAEDQTQWLETQQLDPADVGTAFGLDLAMPANGDDLTRPPSQRG